jgi:hypothetical protein
VEINLVPTGKNSCRPWAEVIDVDHPLVLINPNSDPASVGVTFQKKPQALSFHGVSVTGQGTAMAYAPWPSTNEIPPHGAVIVSLAEADLTQNASACPKPPIVDKLHEYEIVGVGNATTSGFLVHTSLPTVAYESWVFTAHDIDINNVVALRAIPSWDTSYVDVGVWVPVYDDVGMTTDASSLPIEAYNSWVSVVASTDFTKVSVDSFDAGTIFASLAAYDLLTVRRADAFVGQSMTMKSPIALWVGSAGFHVPIEAGVLGTSTVNAPLLTIPQVSDWGHTLTFARQDNRLSSVNERTYMRLVAAANGTVLTYTPTAPVSAPATLDAGQWAAFATSTPFTVASQDQAHPIFMSAHMGDSYDLDGDPASKHGSSAAHIVSAVEGWGKRYDFFMPTNFPDSQVVVTRHVGSPDVTLDCAGAVTGWQNIDSTYEYARVWISKGDNGVFNAQAYGSGTCDNGIHSITSDAPFGVTVYGWVSHPFATYDSLPPPHIELGAAYAYAPLTSHATFVATDAGSH